MDIDTHEIRVSKLSQARIDTKEILDYALLIIGLLSPNEAGKTLSREQYRDYFSGILTFQSLRNVCYRMTDTSREVSELLLECSINCLADSGCIDLYDAATVLSQIEELKCESGLKKRMMDALHSICS